MTGLASRLLALGLLCSALAGASASYRVQPGDTLYRLAQRCGVSVADLKELNGLDGDGIRVGQWLTLPEPAGAEAASIVPAAPSPADTRDAGTAPATPFQTGMAVYYAGRPDPRTALTAAHLSLPLGTWLRVRRLPAGPEVLVLVNDRGPFGRAERIVDLSLEAARALGMLDAGVVPVSLTVVPGP